MTTRTTAPMPTDPTPPFVIHVMHDAAEYPNAVYIGRFHGRGKKARSKWHNQFKITAGIDRAEVIELFKLHMTVGEGRHLDLNELTGKPLACWPAGADDPMNRAPTRTCATAMCWWNCGKRPSYDPTTAGELPTRRGFVAGPRGRDPSGGTPDIPPPQGRRRADYQAVSERGCTSRLVRGADCSINTSRGDGMSMSNISISKFGKDHWSAFAYICTRILSFKGIPDRLHMRSDPNIHPGLVNVTPTGTVLDGSKYPTRLNDGTEVAEHDDWSCLDDFERLGILENSGSGISRMYQLTDTGWPVWHALNKHIADQKPVRSFVLDAEVTT